MSTPDPHTPPPQMAQPLPLRQTNVMAVIGLVSGILSWILLPFIGAIVAVITGHMARKEIRLAPDHFEGDAMAVIGLVLGYLQLALTVLSILFIIVMVLFFGGIAWLAALN
ncbi:MAG: DUF4190 domain-containing protein [Pseudomonadota bacterium]|nr:DUF4190 domain-containing protein [Pseudomonadota bacterium]